jgi:hypothetical protein
MTFSEQVAGDFAEIVSMLGSAATCAGKTLTGVLSETEESGELQDGGYGVGRQTRFRYDPAAQINGAAGFVPNIGARLSAQGKHFRVLEVRRGGSHGLVSLGLEATS